METKSYLFSVVIPVHNKAPHVARSIESVLNQTYQNFELILVDDASSDSSVEEIQKFDDDRINLFHRNEPGPGGYAARNLGIEKANTEWITFLDADDVWNNNHLERYADLIHRYPDTELFSSGWENYKSDSERYFDPYFEKYGPVSEDCRNLSFNEYLLEQVKGRSPVWTSVVCATKKVLIRSGGFPAGKAKRGGDVDTWLRCIEASTGMVWSNHIGAIYYRDSVNMVTKTSKFEAQCERDTVKSLLNKYDGETNKLLKQFSNRRTISAWRQNTFLPDVRNFAIVNKLYYSVDPIKNLTYGVVSLFPDTIFQTIRRGAKALKLK